MKIFFVFGILILIYALFMQEDEAPLKPRLKKRYKKNINQTRVDTTLSVAQNKSDIVEPLIDNSKPIESEKILESPAEDINPVVEALPETSKSDLTPESSTDEPITFVIFEVTLPKRPEGEVLSIEDKIEDFREFSTTLKPLLIEKYQKENYNALATEAEKFLKDPNVYEKEKPLEALKVKKFLDDVNTSGQDVLSKGGTVEVKIPVELIKLLDPPITGERPN
jgi:hypothetical protein